MDARGVDSGLPRTYARSQVFTRADTTLLVAAALLATATLTTTVLLGLFRPIVG
jgi:energy-coupling factor transport system permease protein